MKVKNITKPKDWEIKDRTYILSSERQPLIFSIPTKHTSKNPLTWFDSELGYQRELRYATNQPSPFVDEQEGTATLGHVVMRNGSITVPSSQQNLQLLLSLYHPYVNKGIYKEKNVVKEAENQLDYMEVEVEALTMALKLDIDHAEALLRVEMGNKVSNMTSKEVKRDVLLMAKRNPSLFLELANDENVELRNLGIKAVEAGILALSTDRRVFSLKSSGRKLMNVPFDEHPYSALAAWFKTDDGLEMVKNLEKKMKIKK
jgi:hypothetical protein